MGMESSKYLSWQAHNQESRNREGVLRTMEELPDINNNVEVKLTSHSTPVYLDSRVFFELFTEFNESHSVRSGWGQ